MMPEMDGMQLARAIRADPALSALRIIFMVPFYFSDSNLLPDIGPIQTLTKPIHMAALRKALAPPDKAAKKRTPDMPCPAVPPAPARTTSLLLVEDNQVNRMVLLRQLHKLGFQIVDEAGNGIEALEAASAKPYDLIFMDCQMPQMDGYEASRCVRELEAEHKAPHAGRIPIIAVTAHALQGDREACLEAGMDEYVAKPVRLDDLRRVLNRWLPEESEALAKKETLP
jgi:CheY-like chemotaxis protein